MPEQRVHVNRRLTPHEIAQRVIERETHACANAETLAPAIEAVFAALEGFMATLIGVTGFRAILDRAIHLTKSACPWLKSTNVQTRAQLVITGPTASPEAAEGIARVDASFFIGNLATIIDAEGAAQIKTGAAALLGNILELLCSFIGNDLTERVVVRAWPYLPELSRAPRSEESEP
jgi:hypothetical protein